MADTPSKTEASAENAYAEASADVKFAPAPAAKAAPVKKAAPKKATAGKASGKKVAAAPAKATADAAPLATSTPAAAKAKPAASAKKPAAKRKPAVSKPSPAKTVAATTSAAMPEETPAVAKVEEAITKPTITELKETIMATEKLTDTYTETMTEAVAELQTRAQAAYDKSSEALADMTELAKGNVEAMVEAGKIFAAGVQDLGKTYADEAKSAYETATADIKEMAAVKSPTELFQLQGKIVRRNFDAMVATSSKNTDAAIKLANDTAAPLAGRVNVAAEKFAAVA